MARLFPFLDPIDILHRGEPHVEHETEGPGTDFEDAGHGYDCFMRSRRDMDRLRSEMEELFADLCQVPRLVSSRRGFRPAVDVYRTEDPATVVVVVELAGVDPDATELALADGTLVVSGVRRRRPGDHRVVHMEIDYGPFERRVSIGEPVDAEASEATYTRGLLIVTLPVTERPSKTLRVEITNRRTA
jgi:HSP20 family protein